MPRFLPPPPLTRQQQAAAASSEKKAPAAKPVEISVPSPAEGQELTVNVRSVGNGSIVSTSVQDRDWVKPPVRTEEIVTGAVTVAIRKGDNADTPK